MYPLVILQLNNWIPAVDNRRCTCLPEPFTKKHSLVTLLNVFKDILRTEQFFTSLLFTLDIFWQPMLADIHVGYL